MIPERSHFQNRGGNLFRFLNCGAGTGENESRISFSISFCLQKSRRSSSQNYRVEKLDMDPRPKERRVYSQFLKLSKASHLVDFSLQKPCEEVSVFFVTKTGDKLRLIIDARRFNAHFRPCRTQSG